MTHPPPHLRSALALAALLLSCPLALAGCVDDDDSSGTPGGASGGGAGGAGGGVAAGSGGASGVGGGAGGGNVVLPKLSELTTGQFNFIKTGGETRCAKGAEYGFYVRPGASDRVVIDFSGGGACWDDTTCVLSEVVSPLFSPEVQDSPAPVGIYDHDKAENPLRDWTHVFIPYCTGDVHWGNNVQDYAGPSGPITLQHVGAVNARAVLDWVYREFAAPERAFVTGCSAGSYGSVLWSAHVREHYKAGPTAVAQFGDAGAGIITDTFFAASSTSWKPQSAYPTWIGDFSKYTALSDMYVAIADHYAAPGTLFSQVTTRLDQTQVQFYSFMQGEGGAEGWSQKMLASYKAIDDGTDNFASYVASGDLHCSINRDEFYTISENNVKLVDWVAQLAGGTLPANAACPDCTPPVEARAPGRLAPRRPRRVGRGAYPALRVAPRGGRAKGALQKGGGRPRERARGRPH